jgi:hypothetical protein
MPHFPRGSPATDLLTGADNLIDDSQGHFTAIRAIYIFSLFPHDAKLKRKVLS